MKAVSVRTPELEAVVNCSLQVMEEAAKKQADIKQGRLASETCGRVISAMKTDLEYRLNAPKLAQIEAAAQNALNGESAESSLAN